MLTVLSALIASHESTSVGSGGTFGAPEASAVPARPSIEKPTTRAPLLFRNVLRESSCINRLLAISHPPVVA